jgi:raffinose/stachyose/melibiose transport system substrate-binding protein
MKGSVTPMTGRFHWHLSAFMAALLFSAAASAQTLQVWMLGPSTVRDYMSYVTKAFEKENPGATVKVEMYPNEAFKEQIQIGLQSPNPPDVFYYWPGERTDVLARAGALADLTDYGKRPGWWDERIPDKLLEGYRYQGHQYGVPFEAFGYDMYYNKPFYAAHDLAIPKTMDELLAMCRASRSKAPAIAPIALGNSERWMLVHLISLWNQRMVGADKVESDYTLQSPADQLYTDPGYVSALQLTLKMRDAGCFNSGPNATSPDVATALFENGRAAAMQMSPAYLDSLRTTPINGKFGIYPFPPIPGAHGSQLSLSATESALLMSSKSQHKELAARFINFMTSDAMEAALLKQLGRIPANMHGVDAATLSADVRMSLDDTAAANTLVFSIDNVATPEVANVYLNGGQELLNGTVTPEQLMDRVRAAARDDLAKFGH